MTASSKRPFLRSELVISSLTEPSFYWWSSEGRNFEAIIIRHSHSNLIGKFLKLPAGATASFIAANQSCLLILEHWSAGRSSLFRSPLVSNLEFFLHQCYQPIKSILWLFWCWWFDVSLNWLSADHKKSSLDTLFTVCFSIFTKKGRIQQLSFSFL